MVQLVIAHFAIMSNDNVKKQTVDPAKGKIDDRNALACLNLRLL